MTTKAIEVNYDSFVAPYYNFAGLGLGNFASTKNAGLRSNPKKAALEGLKKMNRLYDLGLVQGILPFNPKPDFKFLRSLGITGSNYEILEKANKISPYLLANVYSSACLWSANAATISPSADTLDNLVHFTPANLAFGFHRSLDQKFIAKLLKIIFNDQKHFKHHKQVYSQKKVWKNNEFIFDLAKANEIIGDEGAANHLRLGDDYADESLEIYVYGYDDLKSDNPHLIARQSLEAAKQIFKQHKLKPNNQLFLKQNSAAIDSGVFHNDVVCVGNLNVLFLHDKTFEKQKESLEIISKQFDKVQKRIEKNTNISINRELSKLEIIEVSSSDVSLNDVIESYMFNSQLITLPNKMDGKIQQHVIFPQEAYENKASRNWIERRLINSNNITSYEFLEVGQSMKNGGGPACLRLRVVLNNDELAASNQNFIFNQSLYQQLKRIVEDNYRDRLEPKDLLDPNLLDETEIVLDKLTEVFKVPNLYL